MTGHDAPPVRVLVVDDSVVVRLLLGEVLAEQQDLQLVGVAPNGRAGLDKIAQLKPDVVVLDVEMPGMSGLETLAELRRSDRRLPVVMFSTLTSRGASATIEALTLGASDYLAKPSTGTREQSLQVLRDELLPKLRALGRRAPARTAAPTAVAPPQPRRRTGRIECVVIGISTGGPNALAAMLPSIPADLRVPIVIVQHMPPLFTGMLAERLNGCSPLAVAEAKGGELMRAGQVWVAPGGHHLKLTGEHGSSRIVLDDSPPENSCRPAVDVLFRSAAAAYGDGVLAVVMTGMGKDGFEGSRVIREAGGQVLAQDEPTSVVWGMPRFVAEGGLADAVLPLEGIAAEITRRVGPKLAPRLVRT